jgi:pyridoxine 4-dehydrogenase
MGVPTIELCGVTVNRMGYGTMRLVGDHAWGEPPIGREAAIRVLRRAVELGVGLIDTADAYGPAIAEEIVREALHPYAEGVLIATKGGITRQVVDGTPKAAPVGRPEYLHQCVEMSLRRLGMERILLYQLHRIDAKVPAEESLGKLAELRQQGKIGEIGLSEVTVEQIERARKIVPIVSVQNKFNLSERKHDAVLAYCEQEGIAFLPWYPVDAGRLSKPDGPLCEVAKRKGVTATQLSLAWLLGKSPVVMPIPGTSSLAHLEENVAAAEIKLSEDEIDEIELIADTQRS